eukprot:6202715-Pleurochrysis_carterae.AAC.1
MNGKRSAVEKEYEKADLRRVASSAVSTSAVGDFGQRYEPGPGERACREGTAVWRGGVQLASPRWREVANGVVAMTKDEQNKEKRARLGNGRLGGRAEEREKEQRET